MADWLTAADRIRLEILWPDADGVDDDVVLGMYLAAAREACEAYAPPLPEGQTSIPDSWVLAQVMQARNLWNSGNASPAGGDFDGGGYGLTTHPLDWQVMQLLRPRRGIGAIW